MQSSAERLEKVLTMAEQPLDLVDPFIGVDGPGNTHAGPILHLV